MTSSIITTGIKMTTAISAKRSLSETLEGMTWKNSGEHESAVLSVFQTRMNATLLDASRSKSLFSGKKPEIYNIHTNVAYPWRVSVPRPSDLDVGTIYMCAQPAGKQSYPDCVAFRFLNDVTVRFIYIEAKQDKDDDYKYYCNSIRSRPRHQKRHVWVIGKRPFLGTALCSAEQFQQNKEEQSYLEECQEHIRKRRKTGGHWVDHRAAILTCSVKGLDFQSTSDDVANYLKKISFIV
jgi:hypothetical protein